MPPTPPTWVSLRTLRADLEAVAVGRLPVDLAEVQVFLERQSSWGRAAPPRRPAGSSRRHAVVDVAGHHGGRRCRELLAFVGHEEVHLVLDDRAAERDAVFIRRATGLLAGIGFGRGRRAPAVAGVGAEHLAVELVGAGLGLRGDRRAGDLVVLGLVVGGDHPVLADRQLRERVAQRRGSDWPADAAAVHVVLLADAVDEHVDVAAGVCAPRLHRRLAALVA